MIQTRPIQPVAGHADLTPMLNRGFIIYVDGEDFKLPSSLSRTAGKGLAVFPRLVQTDHWSVSLANFSQRCIISESPAFTAKARVGRQRSGQQPGRL